MDRYWVRENKEPWREVSKEEFVRMERRAGFNGPAGELATSGFSSCYRPGQPDEHNLEGTIIDPARRTW